MNSFLNCLCWGKCQQWCGLIQKANGRVCKRLKRVFLPGVCLALFPNCIYSRSSLACPRLKPLQSGLFRCLVCLLCWGGGVWHTSDLCSIASAKYLRTCLTQDFVCGSSPAQTAHRAGLLFQALLEILLLGTTSGFQKFEGRIRTASLQCESLLSSEQHCQGG